MIRTFQIGCFVLLAALWAACSSPSAEAFYEQGKQFREADKPVEAMRAFTAATRVKSNEFAVKGRSFSNMATMCRKAEQHELAFSLYARSREQFRRAHDTVAEAYALNNMAWEKAVLFDKPAAMSLIDSALSLSQDPAVQAKVLESRAAAYLYHADLDSALLCTASSPEESVYLDMVRALAFALLVQNDSAVVYARKVLPKTDNPRYLDDIYYILTNCDSAAVADDIRLLSSKRADVQRLLERNNPEWMTAMHLAQAALVTPRYSKARRVAFYVGGLALWFIVALALVLFLRRRSRKGSLEQQCRELRKAPDVKAELRWNDYPLFRQTCNARLSGIVDKLEQKDFTEREIRIAVLVLIGFSYAEIAQILFRAESGIGKDKYLIAKHLGVSVKELQPALRKIANSDV